MTGAAAWGAVNHKQGLVAVVIQLAEGITAFLPFSIGVIGGFRGCFYGLWRLGFLRFNHLTADKRGQIVMAQPAFCGKGRLAATACGRDSLAPFRIGDVTRCKHTFQGGFWSAGLGDEITAAIAIELAFNRSVLGV